MEYKEMLKKLNEFEEEYYILFNATNMLYFDLRTSMPESESDYRSKQLEYFSLKLHKMITSKDFEKIIKFLSKKEVFEKLSKDDKKRVEKYAKKIRDNTKLPEEFVEKFEKAKNKAYMKWVEARDKNDYSIFEKEFKEIVHLSKKKIEYLDKKYDHPYDTLLEDFEEGMTTAELKEIIEDLKPKLKRLYKDIKKSQGYKNRKNVFKGKKFSESAQLDSCMLLYDMMMPDKKRFNWARTVHPFMIRLGYDDVRVTTAVRESTPMFSFGSSSHECGHALYELGMPKKYANSILLDSPSMGIHESQSRFWENHVIHSKEFWEGFYPKYKSLFSKELKGVTLKDFYQTINNVDSKLVRIEGDELTYPFHIIIRFEIEVGLFEGSIHVKDIPKIWNERYKEFFGKTPKNMKEGVLQDVHWSEGLFGYFPTYLLGSIYASMFFNMIKKEKDVNIEEIIRKGDFAYIREWLGEKIHKYGNTVTAKELVNKVCGTEIDTDIYVDYLSGKFYNIYNVK